MLNIGIYELIVGIYLYLYASVDVCKVWHLCMCFIFFMKEKERNILI